MAQSKVKVNVTSSRGVESYKFFHLQKLSPPFSTGAGKWLLIL